MEDHKQPPPSAPQPAPAPPLSRAYPPRRRRRVRASPPLCPYEIDETGTIKLPEEPLYTSHLDSNQANTHANVNTDDLSTRSLQVVDPESGKAVGEVYAKVDKPKYSFLGWRYLSMGVALISKVLRERLTPLEMRLALWLPTIADYHNNQVHVPLKKVQHMWPTVDKSSLSKALRRLVEIGVLRKEPPLSVFTINPNYAWSAGAKEHREFVEAWNQRAMVEDRKKKGMTVPVEMSEENIG